MDKRWKDTLRYFRCHSLKPQTTSVDSLECCLKTWKITSFSNITMVRKHQEFSKGADCRTLSRWFGLKHSPSVWILNASQNKSNPVCAPLVCTLTFPPPDSTKPCYSDEKKLNTIRGKDMLDVKTYWLLYNHLSLMLSNHWFDKEIDVFLHVKINTICVMQGPAWESERSLPEILRPFVRLSAVVWFI